MRFRFRAFAVPFLVLTIMSVPLTVATPVALSAPAISGDAEIFDDAETALPVDLVDAVARDLRLSPAEYLDRAESARRAADFADSATQWDSFAGALLNSEGDPVVAVTDGPTRTAVTDAANAAGFAVVLQPAEFQRALLDTAELEPALLRTAEFEPALLLPARFHTALLQPALLQPALLQPVAVATDHPLVAESLHSLWPFDPALIAGPVRPSSYLAGDSFLAGTPAGLGLRCSLGFSAVDPAHGAVNITAGHCNPDSIATGSASSTGAYPMYGSLVGSQFGSFYRTSQSNLDYALIDIDDANVSEFESNAVRVPGAAPLHITGTVDPIVGAPVCKSGSTTGFSCGTILSTGRDIALGDRAVNNSFSSSICALHGDSGGPVVSGTLAVGISTASNVGDQTFCEVATVVSLLQGGQPELFATPINSILAENPGLYVRTN